MSRVQSIEKQIGLVARSLGIRLSLIALKGAEGFDYSIRLIDLPEPKGFSLLLGDDYLNWTVKLKLDDFSGHLVALLRSRLVSRGDLFDSFCDIASKRSHKFEASGFLNELHNIDEDLVLRITQTYSSLHTEFETLYTVLLDSLCILLSLIVENENWIDADGNVLGAEEGDPSSQVSIRYERNRYNRAICLKFYGFVCRGCGLIMEERYGPIAANIIHVHHLIPVSKMGSTYRLDPIRDLIPLCPNCHNVVHREDPPITIDQLKLLTGFVENN